jgi:hypothetical protein
MVLRGLTTVLRALTMISRVLTMTLRVLTTVLRMLKIVLRMLTTTLRRPVTMLSGLIFKRRAALTQRDKGAKNFFYREIMEFMEIKNNNNLNVLHDLPVKNSLSLCAFALMKLTKKTPRPGG